jgi:DNA-binding CsgD family transcriptional regulator
MLASKNTEWSKGLSRREREVALLIAQGLSNKEVARALGLSAGTVKSHVHNILQKLGKTRRYSLIPHLQELPSLPLAGSLDNLIEDSMDGGGISADVSRPDTDLRSAGGGKSRQGACGIFGHACELTCI